jgi:hypothetical protein
MKLGAKAIAEDMCNCPEEEKGNSKMWCAGFFAGIHELKAITDNELDWLTNSLKDM